MTEEKCEFKSAKDLGLTDKEWAALITTLTLLEHDAIRHEPYYTSGLLQPSAKEAKGNPVFNMATWRTGSNCGTVMCIGGSAEVFGGLRYGHLGNKALKLIEKGEPGLQNLFHPPGVNNWRNLTTKQAAKALRHYLKTGSNNAWGATLRQ